MKSRVSEFVKRARIFRNWWKFVPPFNRTRHNVVAKLWDGSKILVRDIGASDYSTLVEMVGGDGYCLDRIGNPSVVVDVGAHIGIFSVLVARRFPHATVYAIEPDAQNYQALLHNIALNHLTNIIPLNVAVAGEYGTASFFESPLSVGHSIVDSSVGKETVQVETIPLSHFPHIDALKFDAEGAEYLLPEIPSTSYLAIEIHNFAGQNMEKVKQEVRSKFNIIREDTTADGHVTLVGVKPQ